MLGLIVWLTIESIVLSILFIRDGKLVNDTQKFIIILFCLEKKYKEILLITGKGMHTENEKEVFVSKEFSKLKYSVPNFIKTDLDLSKHISSISNAKRKDGGEGAIIIKLKSIV